MNPSCLHSHYSLDPQVLSAPWPSRWFCFSLQFQYKWNWIAQVLLNFVINLSISTVGKQLWNKENAVFSSFQNDIDFSFLMGLSQLPSVLEGGSGVGCTSFLILPIGPGLQSFSHTLGGSPPPRCHPLPEGRMPRGSHGSAEPPCGAEWRNKSQDRRGRQILAPKLVCLRIPRTCDYMAKGTLRCDES